jgi:uncharacterized protein YdeI (YjbR/CyaY-like superfamily)
VFLKDELGVLVNAQEGVTKALRQWRFSSIEEINETAILTYISEAIANEKLGKTIKPEKKERIVSDFFQKELEENSAFAQSFAKLSPYKQRDYLEYIEDAKRLETKQSRMEKIKPMILTGIGLNDKYK